MTVTRIMIITRIIIQVSGAAPAAAPSQVYWRYGVGAYIISFVLYFFGIATNARELHGR